MVDNQELPFEDISKTPTELTATNTLLRVVEGLAFRYRWATENLSEDDIKFSESPPALPFPSLSACSARQGRRWECLGLPSWPGLPAHPPLLAAAPGGPGHET